MIRIFVALPVPPDVAEHLAALLPADLGGLKRVGPELMHITLAFVGWLAEQRVEQVGAAVRVAASGARPFEVELAGVGRFPPSGRPRVVWAATAPASADLIEGLGAVVRDALAEASIPFDLKPLRPHITLARVREDAALEEARAIGSAVARSRLGAGLRFPADSVHVMRSTLSPRGPRYSSLAQIALEGREE